MPTTNAHDLIQRYQAGERGFHGAILNNADLREANLREVNLNRANLTLANLSRADLSDAMGLLDTDKGGGRVVALLPKPFSLAELRELSTMCKPGSG